MLLYQGASASLLVSDKALTACSGCTLCISCVFCNLCCVLSARAVEALCRCFLNPFPHLCINGQGQGTLLSSSSVKLWLPPELCNTVCLHWSGEERGFLNLTHLAAAQELSLAQTWLEGPQEAPAANAKLPLLLFKSKFPPVYHQRGLKNIHSSLYLLFR